MNALSFSPLGRIAAMLMLGYCSNSAVAALLTDPHPAQIVDDAGLHSARFGQISFMARDGHELTALVYRSTNFNPVDGPIWFVMHGASRATERYINTAAPVAERHNALAIAIYFTKTYYPRSSDYTLGLTTSGKADSTALEEGRWREPEDYLHSEIEHVFESVRKILGGQQPGYFMFGHSAGGQFTHRMLTFRPDARVLGAVAANAGWYTLPVSGSGSSYTMPYGLNAAPLNESDKRAYLAAPLTVLVGERDTRTPATDSMLPGNREAMLQGRTRRERGQYYFDLGASHAQSLDSSFGWRFATAPRAKHSAAQVIDSAAFFLFTPGEDPCVASDATEANDLAITEILADPPKGLSGDANGDGERDSLADEFVELVNTGSSSICLSGWALGDVSKPERHVFPLGRALAPGQAMVVFGGGIPTGLFAGATVQWAAFGDRLKLSNSGDVLTLSDNSGKIAKQVSWGDCAGAPCAADHIPRKLNINGSMMRWPESDGTWTEHAAVSETLFSPGTRANGDGWQTTGLN